MEHRHKHRSPLLEYLDVLNADDQTLIGHLGDISGEGIMLLSTEDIALNSDFNILIEYRDPEVESPPPRYLRATINTRWSRPNMNPAWHCIGCHFTHIDEESRALVQIISEHFSFQGEDIEVKRVAD